MMKVYFVSSHYMRSKRDFIAQICKKFNLIQLQKIVDIIKIQKMSFSIDAF